MCENSDSIVVFLEDLITDMEQKDICGWRVVEVAEYTEVTINNKVFAKVYRDLYRKDGDVYIDHAIGEGDAFDGIIIKPISDKLAVVIDYIL